MIAYQKTYASQGAARGGYGGAEAAEFEVNPVIRETIAIDR